MVETVFTEISIIIAVALTISGIMAALKQPLIIGYILTGILLGPNFLSVVKSTESIATFAEMGVVILLFMVGLGLNPNSLKDVGKISIITGIGQIIFTSIIGFAISSLLGFSVVVSLYIAIALTFSSTIIIMKILQDKNDTETLYGRIAIGFLIVQDIVAMLILMIVSSLAFSQSAGIESFVVNTTVKIIFLLSTLYILSLYVLPKVMEKIAKNQELLLLFSVGWCLLLASVFHKFGFSIEIGALLAGVALSVSPFRYEIASKMKPLRDLFILLFFILLGSQMVFTNIGQYLIPVMIFSGFILFGNPLIVVALMGSFGYTKKNSFRAGLTVAQISEFSLILVALGVTAGHLTPEILSMVTVVGLITIAGSTYAMLHVDTIYPKLAPFLSMFERKGKKVDDHKYHDEDGNYDVMLFGYDRVGYDLLESLKKLDETFLVVDYNPDIIKNLADSTVACRYGDASDCELLSELKLGAAKMLISTIPDFETNLLLVKKIREVNPKGIVITVSHQVDEAIQLYEEGATYVMIPQFIGGHHTSTLIEEYRFDVSKFLKEKANQIEGLYVRKNLGHDHPKHIRREKVGNKK